MTYTYVTEPAPAAEALRATFAAHGDTVAEAAANYAGAIAEAVAVLLDHLDALIGLRGEAGEITSTDVRDDHDVIGSMLSEALGMAEGFADALAATEPDPLDDDGDATK